MVATAAGQQVGGQRRWLRACRWARLSVVVVAVLGCVRMVEAGVVELGMGGAGDDERVAALRVHPRSGVVSATLTNGVVVHVRRMPAVPASGAPQEAGQDRLRGRTVRAGRMHVAVALNGGELWETARTRGVTLVASGAFEREGGEPAEGGGGRGARVSATVMPDALLLRMVGDAGEVEEGLRWLHGRLCLAEGWPIDGAPEWVDDAVFERQRERVLAMLADERQRRWAGVSSAVIGSLLPGVADARVRPVSAAAVAEVEVAAARAWAARLALEGPIEIGVAGDVDPSTAIRMVARTFGGLSARAEAVEGWGGRWREVARGPLAAEGIERAGGDAAGPGRGEPASVVVVGFRGAELAEVREHRLLRAAAAVLTDECRARLGQGVAGGKWGEVGGAGGGGVEFEASPGVAYRGTGHVAAVVRRGDVGVVVGVMDELAERGPTLEALARSVRGLVEQARAFEGDPLAWSGVLSRSRVLGVDPEALAGSERLYEGLTAGEVGRVLRERAGKGKRFEAEVGGGG